MSRLSPIAVAVLMLVASCTSVEGASEPSPSDEDSVSEVTTSDVPEALASAGRSSDDVSTTSSVTPSTSAPATNPPVDACASQPVVAIGLKTASLDSGGNRYGYQWTVPSSYVGEALPVVLDFHALGSTGAQQALLSGLGALAEAEGFIVVEPTALPTDTDPRSGWELAQFDIEGRDDVAFVVDLLDHLSGQVCIDHQRIHAIGMSNGAMFTSSLVCELADRITSAVSVAGVTHPDSCDPSGPVSYLAFHGTADTTVPYGGGGLTSLAGAEGSADFFQQVMPDEFAEFAADFGCGELADSPVSALVTLRTWVDCDDGVELGFYTVTDGGHTWPGSPTSALLESLGVTNMDIDATAIAWNFFERSAATVQEA